MRRISLILTAVIFVLSSTLLHAEDRCKSNEKIHEALKKADEQHLDFVEVNLGKVNPKLRPTIRASAAADPVVIFFQNGVNIVEKDFEVDVECWDLFFDYVIDSDVFLGAIVANFEDTSEAIQVVFDLDGPKRKVIKKSKVIPALTILAYFPRVRLSSDPGPYALTTKLLSRRSKPFVLLHQLQTFFYVNDTQL